MSEPEDSYRLIDRLHIAARLFRWLLYFTVIVVVLAVTFLLFPEQASFVVLSGRRVRDFGGIVLVLGVGAILLLSFWSMSLVLNGVATSLEYQAGQYRRIAKEGKSV